MGDVAVKLHILRNSLRAAYDEWHGSVWTRDLDSQWCCDGRECCCGGSTVREIWAWETASPRLSAIQDAQS